MPVVAQRRHYRDQVDPRPGVCILVRAMRVEIEPDTTGTRSIQGLDQG